jgi:hypothetical protein
MVEAVALNVAVSANAQIAVAKAEELTWSG